MPTRAETSLSPAEDSAVESLIRALRSGLGAQLLAVWLYGSRARGEPTAEDSDVDLTVIVESPPQDPFWIDGEVVDAELAETERVDLSVLLWTREHLAARREIRSFFVQELDRDRIVLDGERL